MDLHPLFDATEGQHAGGRGSGISDSGSGLYPVRPPQALKQ